MRNIFAVIAVLFVAATLVSANFEDSRREGLRLRLQGYNLTQGEFGHNVYTKKGNDTAHTVVEWSRKPLIQNRAQMESLHKTWMNRDDLKEAVLKCQANANHTSINFFEFLAATIGTVNKKNTTFTFPGRCFKNITVVYTETSDTSVEIDFIASERNWDPFCMDYYLIGHALNLHLQTIYFSGHHKLTLKNLDLDQWDSINKDGLHIFGLCDSAMYLFPNLIKSAMLFLGGLGLNPWIPFFGPKPPSWMVQANVEFVKAATGYEWKKRKAGDVVVDLDESDIQDGDQFIITRFDGLDQFIEYATGAHNGHCTVAMRIDGHLYVLEAQAGWYWPKKNVQRTPYKEWIKFAHDAGYNVALLPLKPEIRKKFNRTSALEWFRKVEGMPYGYHNFLFAGIDTTTDNIPPLLDIQFTPVVFNLVSKLIPSAIDSIWNEAMSKRLNVTRVLTVEEQYKEILKRNLTLPDVWKIPEVDFAMYSDGYSYVCSAFNAGLFKAAGLFGNLTIQATEFTPRDIYTINFIDKNPILPLKCKQTDPDMPYCILMGEYVMDVRDEYSTIEPYDHMNENCGSLPPSYTRNSGC